MAEENNKKGKTIKVDKEFLKAVVNSNAEVKKSNEEIKKDMEIIRQQLAESGKQPIPTKIGEEKDIAFICAEISFNEPPKTPQDILVRQTQIKEFRNKLKKLMLEYRVGQFSASILKKL